MIEAAIRFFKLDGAWYADVKGRTLEDNEMVAGADQFLQTVDDALGGRGEVTLTVADALLLPPPSGRMASAALAGAPAAQPGSGASAPAGACACSCAPALGPGACEPRPETPFLAKLIRVSHDGEGASYVVTGPMAERFDAVGFRLWICNVTHDVFGDHPLSLYILDVK